MKVINGENQILGRVASRAAKMALEGEEVRIVNAENMVMTGKMPYLIDKYWTRRHRKDKADPEHSQHWPRRPDMFVKRIIRGMLPDDRARGRNAYKRIKTYIGFPETLRNEELMSVPGADASKLHSKYHTVKELCSRLGHRKE